MEISIHLLIVLFCLPRKRILEQAGHFGFWVWLLLTLLWFAWTIEQRTDMPFLALLQHSVGKMERSFSCNEVLKKQKKKTSKEKSLCSSCELMLSEFSCWPVCIRRAYYLNPMVCDHGMASHLKFASMLFSLACHWVFTFIHLKPAD